MRRTAKPLAAAGQDVYPVAVGAGLALLGRFLADDLAGARALHLEGILVVRNVHGVVVPLAIAILPLQTRMMENRAPIALVERATLALTNWLYSRYGHALFP